MTDTSDGTSTLTCRVKQNTTTPFCELIGEDNTVDWKCEKCQDERNKIYEGMGRMTCNGSCAGNGNGGFDVKVKTSNCEKTDTNVWNWLKRLFVPNAATPLTTLETVGCTFHPVDATDNKNLPKGPVCQSIDATICRQFPGFGTGKDKKKATKIQWLPGGSAKNGGTSMVECVFNTKDVLATPGFADTWAKSCLISNTKLPVSPTKKAADLDNAEKEKMYRAYCGGAAASPETGCQCFEKSINNAEVTVPPGDDSGDSGDSGDSSDEKKPAVNLDDTGTTQDTAIAATTPDGVNFSKDVESVVWVPTKCDTTNTQQCSNLMSNKRSEACKKFLPAPPSSAAESKRENGPLYFPDVLKVRDELIEAYCNDYPDAPDCACANRQRDPMFQAMTSGFAQLGTNYNASCWWQPCQQSQNVLIPTPKMMGVYDVDTGNAKCAEQLCVNQLNVTGGDHTTFNIRKGAKVEFNNNCARTINVKKKTSNSSASSSSSTSSSTSSSKTENITNKGSTLNIGLILGVSGGALLFVVVSVALILYFARRKV